MGMYVYTEDFADAMREDYNVSASWTGFDGESHQRALEPALGLTFRELL